MLNRTFLESRVVHFFTTEELGDRQCSYITQVARFRKQRLALAAATFVGLQSIPVLAVLYDGYVNQK